MLPAELIGGEICTKLDALSRLSLIDAFPFLQSYVSWTDLDISSETLDGLLDALGLFEKHIGKDTVQKIKIECKWITSAGPHIAPLVMSSLCRTLIFHAPTITEVSINFTHVEKIVDPADTFRHCLITASDLFVQCMNMPRVHTLHMGGLGVSGNWRTLGAASPPGYYACVSIDGVYAIPKNKKRWTCMYMDDEEGLAFLEISDPHTVCEHHVQRFSWHKDHVATYVDDEGAWTGGMRFVPGDPAFFAFPMFVTASLAHCVTTC